MEYIIGLCFIAGVIAAVCRIRVLGQPMTSPADRLEYLFECLVDESMAAERAGKLHRPVRLRKEIEGNDGFWLLETRLTFVPNNRLVARSDDMIQVVSS